MWYGYDFDEYEILKIYWEEKKNQKFGSGNFSDNCDPDAKDHNNDKAVCGH